MADKVIKVKVDKSTAQKDINNINKALKGAGQSTELFKGQTEKSNTVQKKQQLTLAASGKSMIAFGSSIYGVIGSMKVLTNVISTTREWEKLQAVLETVTGSAENASLAWDVLSNFAKETPYNLEQSIGAFNKLVSLGLEPSERALRSFGDTASAMGGDLTQMVEAVADASVGEFERLKAFGIKASNQGDTISFMFRGMATEVGNSSDEIQNYLIELGENNFAGAMEKRMATLDGALNNLGDSWNNVTQAMFDGNPSDAVESAVRSAIDALDELEVMVKSGQLSAYGDAIFTTWTDGFEDMGDATVRFLELFGDSTEITSELTEKLGTTMKEVFLTIPQNINVVWSGAMYGIVSAMNAVTEATLKADIAYENMFGDSDSVARARIELNNFKIESAELEHQLRLAGIAAVEDKEAAIENFDAQIKKAKELRAEWEANQKARRESTALENLVPDAQSGNDSPQIPSLSATEKARKKQLDDWIALTESYNNTEEQNLKDWRDDELTKLEEWYELNKDKKDQYEEALYNIGAKWDDESTKLEDKRRQDKLAKDKKAQDERLAAFSAGQDALNLLANAAEGRSAKLNAIVKGAAIFQASNNVILAASQALALPGDASLPQKMTSYALVASAGASLLSQFNSISEPSRQAGGYMQSGTPYQVGGGAHTGDPEMYQSGGKSYLIDSQAGMMTRVTGNSGGQPGQSGGVAVSINNYGQESTASVTDGGIDENGVRQMIIEMTPNIMAKEANNPSSPYRSAMSVNSKTQWDYS